ncbi:MAG: glycosyltransferase family 4 protein [Candidatus Gracilibacteria bacterium]|nr:glycosyltransferase family 4 protein [Candidatus Gracilibacteria bacterium]
MKKIDIIQFLPYFPPHKGGLEDVAEWMASAYVQAGYGEVLNVVFSVGQEEMITSPLTPLLGGDGDIIGYERDGYKVVILPAFDLVKNFPFPAFWRREFWDAFREVRKFDAQIIQTHTRFFLSSLIGGIYAKRHRKKWVHIEHGSGYVVSDKWMVAFFSKLFDRTIGLWILRSADSIIAISEACKRFVQSEFADRDISVIYRGMDILDIPRVPSIDGKVRIAFVGRLVHLKGVRYLLEALKSFDDAGIDNISCRIVGDGEERGELETFVQDNKLESSVAFLGFLSKNEILSDILPTTDIFVNPSLQEGLPTTVIEALLSKCMVVATDVGGTREISDKEDLIIVSPEDSNVLYDGMKEALLSYKEVSGSSYASVRERFDSGKNIGRMYEVYGGIV